MLYKTTATAPINFMGHDFTLEIVITIHPVGSGPSGSTPDTFDPGTDADYDIHEIRLFEDRCYFEWDSYFQHDIEIVRSGPVFTATGELFNVLLSSRACDDAILSAFQEASS